jgi:hydroxyethylthiazole kinase-like uncharacterized protein yjeF
MKIFETKEIREIDAYTIHYEPISSTDLMERAAAGCSTWITENLPVSSPLIIFTGPGNNGGDGWAIARQLADKGYKTTSLFHLKTNSPISADTEVNRQRLMDQCKVPVTMISSRDDFPEIRSNEIVIDALFGSGLSRPLEGLPALLVKHINNSRCLVISIDIPSGLMGEDNTDNAEQAIIKASDTLTFQFPKRCFFYAENEEFVGKWHIIPIGLHPGIISQRPADYYFTLMEDICCKLKPRKVFSHKGTYGHALLIAGSFGMMGAAILAAQACLRTGVGLLTTHVPGSGYPIIQAAVPESIFNLDDSDTKFCNCPPTEKYSALGAGPGIGTDDETISALETLIKRIKKPLILDADALNILASRPDLLDMLPENTIITPHPGEFDRLAGKSNNAFVRNKKQIAFSIKYKIIILLKGAYTSITLPDGSCFFNSTGNPGMATAGCGDVLTGMILSLLAQGYSPNEAAILGTFIHGLAGDFAAAENGQQALIASDIVKNIGYAFKKIESYEVPFGK